MRSYAWRSLRPRELRPFHASWGLHLPWAHPVWDDYALILFDLTTPIGEAPQVHLPGATHEFILYAVHPSVPLQPGVPLPEQYFFPVYPSHYRYQLRAASDAAITARLHALVERMVQGRLSPDTDYRHVWDAVFADALPLVRSAFHDLVQAATSPRH